MEMIGILQKLGSGEILSPQPVLNPQKPRTLNARAVLSLNPKPSQDPFKEAPRKEPLKDPLQGTP